MKHSRSGQSFLALVLLIGAIIAVGSVTIAFLANSFVNSGYGYQQAVLADSAANSGVQDAMLQLDRNTSFSSTGYMLPVGSSTATVSVTQSLPSAGYVTVSSTATVSAQTRTVQVVLSENINTGQFTISSWVEAQ